MAKTKTAPTLTRRANGSQKSPASALAPAGSTRALEQTSDSEPRQIAKAMTGSVEAMQCEIDGCAAPASVFTIYSKQVFCTKCFVGLAECEAIVELQDVAPQSFQAN